MSFRLEEEVVCEGRRMRVAGLIRMQHAEEAPVTRYLLTEESGAPVILEDADGQLSVLRPFPPDAQPEAGGGQLVVDGEKYRLVGTRRLKILGSEGQPPGGPLKGEVLLSGVFDGEFGALLRELVPGSAAQAFYSARPASPGRVLWGALLAESRETRWQAEAAMARAADDREDFVRSAARLRRALWVAAAAVVAALAYAFLRAG